MEGTTRRSGITVGIVIGVLATLAVGWFALRVWPGAATSAVVPASKTGMVNVMCQKDPGGAGYYAEAKSGSTFTCTNGATRWFMGDAS